MGNTTENQPEDALSPIDPSRSQTEHSAPPSMPASPEPPSAREAPLPSASPRTPTVLSSDPDSSTLAPLLPPLPPDPHTSAAPAASDESGHHEPGAADARQDTTETPSESAPPDAAEAPMRVERGGMSSVLDADTDLMPAMRARPRVQRPSLPDAETVQLSPPQPGADAETTRLPTGRSALDVETKRLRPKPSALEIETARLRPKPRAPEPEPETTQAPPKPPATGASAAPPAWGTEALDAETARLARGQDAADAETARLARKRQPDQAPDYSLLPGRAPYRAPGVPPTSSQPFKFEDDEALWEETEAALALFPSAPSVPDVPLPAPITPAMLNDYEEVGDETLAVIRALRGEMGPRAPLQSRALALVSQPTVAIMALFTLAQMALLAFFWQARPLPDEAAAIAQSARFIQGGWLPGAYGAVSHFTGAPLWPAIASPGYLLGGLFGVRVIAIICAALAGLATASAAKNLFGPMAGVFTAIIFALSGPALYFAHLAVPDQLALLGIAVSVWAITQASETRQREWLIVAGCACAVAMIAQVSALLCLIPLLGVLLALNGRPAATGFFLTGLIVVAIVVSRVFPAPESALALIPGRSRAGLSLSVSVSATALQLLAIGALAWVMVIGGWIAARGQGLLAVTLVAGMLVWPVALALAGSAVDAERHIVFGLLFGLPLVGVAFAALWETERRLGALRRVFAVALLLAVGTVGLLQARALDTGGPLSAPHGIHVTWGKADAGQQTPAFTAVAADR